MIDLSRIKNKIFILSPSTNWKPVIDEVKQKAHLLIGGKDITTNHFILNPIKTQVYSTGNLGIDREQLRSVILPFEDIILLHVPNFPVSGAIGRIHYNLNDKTVIELYKNHLREDSRSGEFKYRTAETIVHELCHKYYRKFGLADRTHYWHYKQHRLLEAVDEIYKHLLTEQVSLLQTIVSLLRKGFTLPQKDEIVKEWFCIHHSATPLTTKAETIIKNSQEQYKKCFYDYVIDKNGIVYKPEAIIKERGTKDICVIGNFVYEVPTKEQITSLKAIIKGHDYIGHSNLAKKGLAKPSLCPGALMTYL
jgi:hypothetical protein